MIIEYLRSFRFLGMAIFDWVATGLAAFGIAHYFKWQFAVVFLILILISIPIHILFGIKTYTNYYLGIDNKPLS